MKKYLSIILSVAILLLCTIIPVSASETAASDSGFTNIRFANGYIGFCIDKQKNGAVTGDKFTQAQSTSVADNNVDGSDSGTNIDSESPATGIGTGGTVTIITLFAGLGFFVSALITRKKSRAR